MKRIILIVIVVLFSQQMFAQGLNLMLPKKKTANWMPIRGNRTYSAVIQTKLSKEELLKKTKEFFIEEELATPEQLKTKNYTPDVSEYKLPIVFLLVQSKGKGMWGAPFIHSPVYLTTDVMMTFLNSGEVNITLTNFDAEVFVNADENKVLGRYKGQKTQSTWNNEPIWDIDKKIAEESRTILAAETGVGKLLLTASKGLTQLNTTLEQYGKEFKENTSKRFKLYEQGLQEGSLVLIDKDNIDQYKVTGPMKKSWSAIVNKFKQDNLVFEVDNYRWEHQLVTYLDYLFKDINERVNGQIKKISLNGNTEYENINGKLLPTNKKLRKKWKKRNISF